MSSLLTVDVIEKIEKMAIDAHEEFETHEINGDLYVNQSLTKVKPETCRTISLTSLCALVDFVKTTVKKSKDQFSMPLGIYASYNEIKVKSSLDKNMERNFLASAEPILPRINFDSWMSMEEFIIQIQTCFVDTPNKQALIELVSKITDSTTATTTDDGISQKVTVSKGTGLKGEVCINPIVKLIPYRTYNEVPQVETMYLIRVKDGGQLKIIEADGGSWKMEAQRRVSGYLRDELLELIESEDVVVIG